MQRFGEVGEPGRMSEMGDKRCWLDAVIDSEDIDYWEDRVQVVVLPNPEMAVGDTVSGIPTRGFAFFLGVRQLDVFAEVIRDVILEFIE